MKLRLAVLVSGTGSNLQAIIDAIESGKLAAQIGLVVSNRPAVPALERAKIHGLTTAVVDHTRFPSREAFDTVVHEKIAEAGANLVCLAGFMRIVSPQMVSRYPFKMLNIHPSLLPQFPGAHAVRDALQAGVKETGCTVHFVTAQVDGGPPLLQARIPVRAGDTEETLTERIHRQEHIIYPQAIGLIAAGRVRIENGTVTIQGGVA